MQLDPDTEYYAFKKKRRWPLPRRAYWLMGLFLLVLIALVLWPRIFFVIESGHAGVIYRTFWGGTVTQNVRDEGLQVIFPWNTMTIYDVRLQQVEQSFKVISADGLEIDVVLSIRYRPKVEFLGLLHKKIGPDYLRKIVIPDVHSLIRTTFGQYTPEEMYTTKRSLIQETFQRALSNLGDKFVEMDDLLIKSIGLPQVIKSAIENKLVEQQRMLEMRYRIERETQEAERKAIEAKGVDYFQSIVARSLTPRLLQYKGIEALAKLSESSNAKLILAGGGSNGIPLILDTSTGGDERDQSVLRGGAGLIPGLPILPPLPGMPALPPVPARPGTTPAHPGLEPRTGSRPLPTVAPLVKPVASPSPSPGPGPLPTPPAAPVPEATPAPAATTTGFLSW